MSTNTASNIQIHQVITEEVQSQKPVIEPPKMSALRWIGSKTKKVAAASFHLLTGPASAPLIFTCVCVALIYRKQQRAAAAAAAKAASSKSRPMFSRSVSMAVLHGGDKVIERIIAAHQARNDETTLQKAIAEMQELLEEKPKKRFTDLNNIAAKLEMSGQEDKAIEMLEKAIKTAEQEELWHDVHELQMLLVEMLIYKGKYEEAKKVQCLHDKDISDARGPLYLAIINTILNDDDKTSKENYKKFQEIRHSFHAPEIFKEGTQLYHAIPHVDQFEKLVSHLKDEIKHAHPTA